jgi:hypothetical protein
VAHGAGQVWLSQALKARMRNEKRPSLRSGGIDGVGLRSWKCILRLAGWPVRGVDASRARRGRRIAPSFWGSRRLSPESRLFFQPLFLPSQAWILCIALTRDHRMTAVILLCRKANASVGLGMLVLSGCFCILNRWVQ